MNSLSKIKWFIPLFFVFAFLLLGASKEGVSENDDPSGLKGFAVVTASNMDEAVDIAKSDPFLDNGGSIKVYEMMEMGN